MVVKGDKQNPIRDYAKTFTPVARMETMNTLFSIVSQHRWKVYQMDVKLTFLNGVLKEGAYVERP